MMENIGYFAVHTFTFPKIHGPLQFDVFLRLGPNKYTKVFSRGTQMEKERLETYILKGTKYFYLQHPDRMPFLAETLRLLQEARSTGELHSEDTLQILDELTEQSLFHVFQRNSFDQQTQILVRNVVDTYIEISLRNAQVFPALLKMARSKPSTLRHLIMTSIFSTLLARAVDPENTSLILHSSYAGLMHDIGLSQLHIEKDEHSMTLTPQEQLEIRKHPKLGADLLSTTSGVPQEVKTAVLQHHEGFDGSGYPHRLAKDQISLPARIVRLTDEFTSLITGSEGSHPLPPRLASFALAKNTQIDQNLLKVFNTLLKL
jgi:putative nucleotidyltransferase with HDIG domain